MAYISAAKSVSAEGSSPAARVISPSACAGKSPATPCERFGSGREAGAEDHDEDHNGDAGDRSSAGQMNQYAVHGWGSFTSTIFIRTAFLGIWTAKRALGIVPGNFQSEITAAYCG